MFALSERAWLRYIFVFVAYFAQGLPQGLLFWALPVWLSSNGAEPAAVGIFIGTSSLPWALKFVSGFFMDRYPFLPMGKRRAWILGAQAVILIALLVGALLAPSADQFGILLALTFSINLATAFQDVAVDGLAVDILEEAERAKANAYMGGGAILGIAAATAMSGYFLAQYGTTATFLSLAALFALIFCLIALVRERPGERLLPWTAGEASQIAAAQHVTSWRKIVTTTWSAMRGRKSLILILTSIFAGMTNGFYFATMPGIAEGPGGWDPADFANLNAVGALVSGVAGLLVFGFVVSRLGTRASGIVGFGLIILFGLVVIALKPVWAVPAIISGVVIYSFVIDAFWRIAYYSTAMRLSDMRVAATQFSLYMALMNFGTTIAGYLVGPVEAIGGVNALLFAISLSGLIAAVAFGLIRNDDRAEYVPDAL